LTYKTQGEIKADHPSLAGHFPGNPIVPGVVILDEIFSALTAWKNDCQIEQISTVKFLAPIKPGQQFVINLTESKPKRIDFKCTEDDTVFATGKLSLK